MWTDNVNLIYNYLYGNIDYVCTSNRYQTTLSPPTQPGNKATYSQTLYSNEKLGRNEGKEQEIIKEMAYGVIVCIIVWIELQ